MDTEFVILYEIVEPVSNNRFFTSIRDEALEYLESNYMVFEHHKTITQASPYIQSGAYVTLQWHLNPNFTPNY